MAKKYKGGTTQKKPIAVKYKRKRPPADIGLTSNVPAAKVVKK